MSVFKSPAKWLGGINADVAGMMISAMADIALIVDRKGVIRDVAVQNASFAREFADSAEWIGRPWADTVTVESRPKVAEILQAADNYLSGASRSSERHVNYAGRDEADIPVQFTALPVDAKGNMIALGRDLRSLAVLQQRLINVQQSLERDYSRLRHVETRYRILFQMSTEPMLVLDGAMRRILEANPAAQQLIHARGKMSGRAFADFVEPASRATLGQLLDSVSRTGRVDDVRLALVGHEDQTLVSAFVIRHGDSQNFLIRLSPVRSSESRSVLSDSEAGLLKLIENAPDGFVVTGSDGRVVAANAAFLDMAQASSQEQVVGHSLEQWLGRPGVDLPVLTANLRRNGSVRLYSTALRDKFGTEVDVEISAVTVMNGGKPYFGFAIRNVASRSATDLIPPVAARSVPRSLEQISELIGRVSLKEIVREATDVIERLSIEAALDITRDNRASAAEMLGLSRQSLYVKLRRYGMMDVAPVGPG